MYCCVYSKKTPDDGQRNCPKHVEFYSKNKFEKILHLIGFTAGIYIHMYKHSLHSEMFPYINLIAHLDLNIPMCHVTLHL